MKHDQLQDTINTQIVTAPPFALGGYVKFLQALSAVVELHTPVTVKEMNGNVRFKCEECTNWDMGITEQDLVEIAYPCPTIQAIEKELQ